MLSAEAFHREARGGNCCRVKQLDCAIKIRYHQNAFDGCADGANTQCDLRGLAHKEDGGYRTIIPHEVQMEAQVHIRGKFHYFDAAQGHQKDAVRLPLAQVFMYLVSLYLLNLSQVLECGPRIVAVYP